MSYTILHTEASTGWGGQEKRILAEIVSLREKGHTFYLACQPHSKILKAARDKDIKCIPLKMSSSISLSAIYRLRKIIRDNNVDIVNTHSSIDSWLIGFVKFCTSIPLVMRTRHLSTPVTNKFVYTHMTDFIVTTAQSIKESLCLLGVSPENVCSVPTGVDEHLFNPDDYDKTVARKKLNLNDGDMVIGNVSILRSWKGHVDFISVAERVLRVFPRAKFLIVGDGPQRESIAAIIKEKGLDGRVIMLGYREDIPEILSALDIFLFTSYANEGVPQAVLQALAMKKAVVAGDIGGVCETVINEKTGLICQPRDIECMTNYLIKYIHDGDLRQNCGVEGNKRVREMFTLTHTIDVIGQIYERCLKKAGSEQ